MKRSVRCRGCNALVKPGATFCPGCGYRLRGRTDPQRASVLSIVLLVFGVFFALIASAILSPGEETRSAALVSGALWAFLLVAVSALAMVPLGRSAWKTSFPMSLDDRGMLLGFGGGVIGFTIGSAYVFVVGLLAPEAETALPADVGVQLVTVVLLPAIVEELSDRGVLWTAVRRITGPRGTILATALVFSFLHGLAGGFLFELPHRFVLGCLLGWIRWRTDGLAPAMLAHGTNNLLAVLLF